PTRRSSDLYEYGIRGSLRAPAVPALQRLSCSSELRPYVPPHIDAPTARPDCNRGPMPTIPAKRTKPDTRAPSNLPAFRILQPASPTHDCTRRNTSVTPPTTLRRTGSNVLARKPSPEILSRKPNGTQPHDAGAARLAGSIARMRHSIYHMVKPL